MKRILFALCFLFAGLVLVSCNKDKNVADTVKGEGVLTYTEFMAAETGADVKVEAYIQAKQGWWDNNGTGVASIYLQDAVGGYFAYNMPCTQEDYNTKLVVGTKLLIEGAKGSWSGEDEIVDITKYTVLTGKYVASATDVTAAIAKNDTFRLQYNNMLVKVTGTVSGSTLYKWDGSGEAGTNCDLYFNIVVNGVTYTFTVESYLVAEGQPTYNAVLGLTDGETVTVEGFMYWYNAPQMHVTKVTK